MAKPRSTNAKQTKATAASTFGGVTSSQHKPFTAKPRLIALCALLFTCVVFVFSPAVQNKFLSWYGDDPLYVTANSHVATGLTFENIRWALTSTERSNWHPLTWISHMVDCELYGLKPAGHHFTNVLLHAAGAVLLFILFHRMTRATWSSMAIAILFALHPLRAESVAWVSERKDVLSACFWMLTLLMYVRYVEGQKAGARRAKMFYLATLISFALGLMSKGMLVTLPFVMLILDYWPLRRFPNETPAEKQATTKPSVTDSIGRLILEKLPFLLMAAGASVLVYVTQDKWGFVRSSQSYPLSSRIENAIVSYVRYLGKMVWPTQLTSSYPHPGHWPVVVVVVCGAVVIGISVVSLIMRRKRPYLMVGWLWYLGTLVPVIGLIQVGDQSIADRYTYIPMIGILLSSVWFISELSKNWCRRNAVLATATGLILVCWIPLTILEIRYYKDGVTRWRRNLEVTDDVGQRYPYAMVLDDEGRTEEAISEMQTLLKAQPNHAQARMNLGTMFDKLGRVEEAIAQYRETLKIAAGFNDARYNLGLHLLQKGLHDEAVREFKECLKYNPRDARAMNALGTIDAQSGRLNEAIEYFKNAIAIKPDYAEAHLNLGLALMDGGSRQDAAEHLQEALRLDPTSADARKYLDELKQNLK